MPKARDQAGDSSCGRGSPMVALHPGLVATGGTHSLFLVAGPFSLVSRPPKKPLTFSVLAEVFFSSLSAMSFFSASQVFADFR